MAKTIENRLIGAKECPLCKGAGQLPEWLAPLPCSPNCVKSLKEYPQSDGMYYLCFIHTNPVPTLWREYQRENCLKELSEAKVQ